MANVEITMILTGPYAGQTRVLNGWPFDNGVCVLQGDALELQGAIRYLGRAYQAFPEGSDELLAAQQRDIERYGNHGVSSEPQENPERGQPDEVQGDDAAPGNETAEEGADDLGAADDGDGADSLRESSDSGRSGLQHTGDDLKVNSDLRKAIMSLSPDVDEHWTGQGLPAMSAVEEAYGNSGITRKDVNTAAPDYDRDAARKKAAEDI